MRLHRSLIKTIKCYFKEMKIQNILCQASKKLKKLKST